MTTLDTDNQMRSTATPSPQRSPSQVRIDDIATKEILEGLARLHSLVVVSDLSGRVVWMSDALGNACGGTTRHLGGNLCGAFAALPGARKKARIQEQTAHIQSHLRHNEALRDMRLDLGTRDGVARSAELSAFRTETQAGQPIVVSIIHPSEDRAAADSALRGEPDALAGILDCSPDAVLALDRFGFIVYANPAVATLLDLELEKLVDSPIALIVPRSPELVSLLSNIDPGGGAGRPGTIEQHAIEIERPDGRTSHVMVDARPHERSQRIRSVVFLRDITDQVSRQQALERKNAELEAYVHSVSHDLRSPLVSLLGFTRLLRQDYGHQLDDTGRHFADRIEQAARTMHSLIDDLLELSRIGAGGELRSLVDPRPVLQQLRAELKLRLDEMDAQLSIPDSPPFVYSDRTRLYQIFSNMIGNALQHMGECEDRTIEVLITREAEHDVLTVADHGRGIAPDDLARVFDVFYSRGASKNGRASTGVGLAIVRKIAETHGGRAWAESEPGQGARFHVSLPRGR